jgi:multicomponent Na+:H+ antiporter subunit C
MELALAITVGALYAAGAYLLLRRHLVKIILGVVFIGHASNLLIFTAAGLVKGVPAFVPEGASALSPTAADPLPQALVLTAIVIGFGVIAFTLVMAQRAYRVSGTDDLDDMKEDPG